MALNIAGLCLRVRFTGVFCVFNIILFDVLDVLNVCVDIKCRLNIDKDTW